MKLKRFKERDNKRIGIVAFTMVCILLVSGVILYRTFAIFEVKTNQNVINGNVQGMGDIEFAFYKEVDGKDTIVKEVPTKDEGYSLDTSSSYCKDLLNDKQISNVNWDYENWEVRLKNVSTTKTKCYLYFKQIYKDPELNGAIPDLGNGRLIPVKILEDQPTGITIQNMDGSYGGKVVKADITSKWYSYKDKQWANAVILRDGVSDNYAPGDEILESDIESYFVWIPRYRYQLFSENPDQYTGLVYKGNVQSVEEVPTRIISINIIFETKNDGISTGSEIESYLTHPAFTSFNSNGFWVGKFETGYNQNSSNKDVVLKDTWSKNEAQKNEKDSEKVLIKPNVYSWRSIQVANAFYTSYDYLRDLDSHMMKSMEWGAVAYLASSEYGLCKDTSCNDIRNNNNSNYVTGYSAKEAPTCGYTASKEECNLYEAVNAGSNGTSGYNYFDTRSKISSTTGNYTGVYDMSGGASEYVMGVMKYSSTDNTPASGRNKLHNSGFTGPYSCPSCDTQSETENKEGKAWPSSKYYDLYDYGSYFSNFNRGKLGDGTKEFGPFYNVFYYKASTSSYGQGRFASSYYADNTDMVNNTYPWMTKGGGSQTGAESGLMYTSINHGGMLDYNLKNKNDMTFRVVLTP